jgi:NAD(P)-dependent dehydrogenase (short-subunit alcohol dehydrogenase family)
VTPARPVLLVTGGSRGIGAAIALLAGTRGYTVAVNFLRHGEAAARIVGRIEDGGGEAIAVQADVGDDDQVRRMFAVLDDRFGSVRALVNNAGILEPQGRVDAITADRLMRVLRTNVVGAFLCAREAVRRMSTRHGGAGGAIVNLSSIAARLGAPHEYVDYAASKGALDTLTIGLAREVAGEGIRVNAVRPGFIYTAMHAAGGEPDRVDRLKDQLPMKRGGQATEVAHAVLWLLSDEASYCTGSFIDLAGGR